MLNKLFRHIFTYWNGDYPTTQLNIEYIFGIENASITSLLLTIKY